jgi:hypothetical protein
MRASSGRLTAIALRLKQPLNGKPKNPDYPYSDQINRHYVIQQFRHQQNQYAGNQGNQWGQSNTDIHICAPRTDARPKDKLPLCAIASAGEHNAAEAAHTISLTICAKRFNARCDWLSKGMAQLMRI